MSRWFRHYASMMRDEKLVRVAIQSKQSVERVLWIWGAILESAAEINDGGRYDLDPAEAAYFLRADEADIRTIIEALSNAGRLAEGCVAKWGVRQFQSDQSAARQSAYRQRKRTQESDDNVTGGGGDGEVTAVSRPGDAPETETETETNTETKKKKKGGAADADAGFVEFWNLYPRTPVMSKKEAFKEWVKLPKGDQIAATNAIGPYRTFLEEKKDHPVVHACRFLSQRRFEGFEKKQSQYNILPPRSAEWTLHRHEMLSRGESTFFMDAQAEKGNGWPVPRKIQREAAE